MITITQLPPRIAEYMGAHFTTLKNIKLASRFHLSEEQLSALASVLGDVFLKVIAPKDFAEKLQTELKLDKAQAFLLAADAAEQHFVSHSEYLGDISNEIIQWRLWGKQLGGRQPGNQAAPEVERMLAQAQRITPGRRVEMGRTNPIRPKVQKRAQTETVGQKIAARKAQEIGEGPDQATESTQITPEARQKFLTQVRGLTIDALRQGGQSGEAKLAQVAQKITQVLEGAPQERHAISQSLRNSPLFSLYQQIGQETIRSGHPIDQVIYARYQQQQPYLLKEEFDAVAQLVKQIG